MNIALWILQGLLAAAFTGAGLMKLAKTKTQLIADPRMGWAADFAPGTIKLIGLAEVLGAAGLILPMALAIAPQLTAAAAAGEAVLMLGAAATHARRKEPPFVPAVLAVLAIAVVIGRWPF
ncbi:MAG: DoxX family protein [Deltaproteobacteria bacterium]|nr:DoxX family protein [Deltaproteobacteria bacterium]